MQVTGGAGLSSDVISSHKSDEGWREHVESTLESVNNDLPPPPPAQQTLHNEEYYNQLHQEGVQAQQARMEATR